MGICSIKFSHWVGVKRRGKVRKKMGKCMSPPGDLNQNSNWKFEK